MTLMATEKPALIITVQCQGLYRAEEGTINACERPASHAGDCGPDVLSKPYAPIQQRPLAGPAMLAAIAQHQQWIHSGSIAVLLTLAAVWDETGAPVSAEDIASRIHIAPSTALKHLRESSLTTRTRQGWKPVLV